MNVVATSFSSSITACTRKHGRCVIMSVFFFVCVFVSIGDMLWWLCRVSLPVACFGATPSTVHNQHIRKLHMEYPPLGPAFQPASANALASRDAYAQFASALRKFLSSGQHVESTSPRKMAMYNLICLCPTTAVSSPTYHDCFACCRVRAWLHLRENLFLFMFPFPAAVLSLWPKLKQVNPGAWERTANDSNLKISD